jgi:MFS family permease
MHDNQIGGCVAIIPLARFVFSPVWTYVADRTGRRRLVVLALVVASAVAMMGIFFAVSFATLVTAIAFYAAASAGVLPLIDARVMHCLGASHRQSYGAQRLWGAMTWGVVTALVGMAVDGLGNDTDVLFYAFWLFSAVVCAVLGLTLFSPVWDEPPAEGAPLPRWQPLACLLPCLPQTTEFVTVGSETPAGPPPVASIVSHRRVRVESPTSHNPDAGSAEADTSSLLSATPVSPPSLADVSFFRAIRLILNAYIVFVLWVSFCLGFGMQIVFGYLFVFLKDDLKASHTLLGLSTMMTVVFEFPCVS